MKYFARNLLFILLILFLITGCAGQTRQQRGTGVGIAAGAATGAAIGQSIGKSTEATILGAAIGAVIGGLSGNQIGKYMDQQEEELRQIMADSENASIIRLNDVVVATFKGEVFFAFNSAKVKQGAQLELQRLATVLNRYPQTNIIVAGHTDSKGSEDYNLKLSERRAVFVKNILVKMGVTAQRIDARGYGELMPVHDVDDLNRRVEIVITPQV